MVVMAVMSTGLKRSRLAFMTLSATSSPRCLELVRKFDDQNAVFSSKTNQHDEANLTVEVKAHSGEIERTEGAGQGEGNGDENGEGIGKVFNWAARAGK